MRPFRATFLSWLILGLLPLLPLACSDGGADAPDGDGETEADPPAEGEPDGESEETAEFPDADGTGDAEEEEAGLPMELPFEMTRPDEGEPLSEADVRDFTAAVTGLWKRIDYFTWLYETNHGVDESTGLPDYLIWWHDVDAVKSGDTVTFRNNHEHGGSHNNAEPTSLALTQVIGGYLLTGDPTAGKLVELFARSFTAMMKGFVYDENDPNPYIMARNIVARNHSFTLPGGKKKAVDYTDWYFSYTGWNAERFHYPDNPTWGDIWVTTMRSKDDLPYMFRATAWFPYILQSDADESVKAAVSEAWDYMRGFAGDIVEQGYFIRSKDENGNAVIPTEDLASFVDYLDFIPDAECDPRLAVALLASGDPLGIDCGNGQGSLYDSIAGGQNYYNYSIVDGFHMNALHLALITNHVDLARTLLDGLRIRIEAYSHPDTCRPGCEEGSWERDLATLYLEAAALGYPLTSAEARRIHAFYRRAVEIGNEFPNWDLWSPDVPDGVYDFRKGFHPAHTDDAIRVEEIALFLEYCFSPFRNPAGVSPVDCAQVADIARWGE